MLAYDCFMLEQTSNKFRMIFLAAFILGGIGAVGEAYLLYHELANCYPYKIIDVYFYRDIAVVGVYIAPIAAVIAGFMIARKRFWLATIAPVVLCPLFFACVFKAFWMTHPTDIIMHFDGKTAASAAQDFYIYTAGLALTGSIIGGICSLPLSYFSRQRKLA
jgi:hypothetical protein